MFDTQQRPDTGLACLLLLARLHDVAADEAQLQHQFGQGLMDVPTLLLAAQSLQLAAKMLRQDVARFDKAALPAIAPLHDGRFMVLARYQADTDAQPARVLVQHPGEPPAVITLDELETLWTGDLIFITSKASYVSETAKFDFTWFIPAIVKYRRLLSEVLLISLALQLIGLVMPMFFQVVMDKVPLTCWPDWRRLPTSASTV